VHGSRLDENEFTLILSFLPLGKFQQRRMTVMVPALEQAPGVAPKPLDIYLVAPISNIDATLDSTKVDLVSRTNHLSSDGISVRLVVGDILRTLGSRTLSNDIRNISWDDEHKNLCPPLLSVLGGNQATSRQKFETSCAYYMESVRCIMIRIVSANA
jgi:hypothetical protein